MTGGHNLCQLSFLLEEGSRRFESSEGEQVAHICLPEAGQLHPRRGSAKDQDERCLTLSIRGQIFFGEMTPERLTSRRIKVSRQADIHWTAWSDQR
jgi:hypothetical protein